MRTISLVICFILSVSAMAQNENDLFYSHGKIYVVVAVLLIIFVGIALYLFRLDKKISKIENQQKKNEA